MNQKKNNKLQKLLTIANHQLKKWQLNNKLLKIQTFLPQLGPTYAPAACANSKPPKSYPYIAKTAVSISLELQINF